MQNKPIVHLIKHSCSLSIVAFGQFVMLSRCNYNCYFIHLISWNNKFTSQNNVLLYHWNFWTVMSFLLSINQWAIDYIENWFMQFCKLWYREPDEMIRKIKKLSWLHSCSGDSYNYTNYAYALVILIIKYILKK
jgi:hypothetical protein